MAGEPGTLLVDTYGPTCSYDTRDETILCWRECFARLRQSEGGEFSAKLHNTGYQLSIAQIEGGCPSDMKSGETLERSLQTTSQISK